MMVSLKLPPSPDMLWMRLLGRGATQAQAIEEAQKRWQEVGEKRGLQLGKQRGAQEKALTIALRLLHRRVGELDDVLVAQIEKLSTTRLEDLSEAVLDFATVEDLNRWLQDHPTKL